MSKHTRKLIMRCEHPTPCELCQTDCKRAEITAKEDEIRSDLLDACKMCFTACYMNTGDFLNQKSLGQLASAIKKACPNG